MKTGTMLALLAVMLARTQHSADQIDQGAAAIQKYRVTYRSWQGVRVRGQLFVGRNLPQFRQRGAIDQRVKTLVAHVPFLCDMRRAASTDGSLIRSLPLKAGAGPERLVTLDFFDPLNLAHRLRAPTLISAGGKDTVCPADTIRAVVDRGAGIKSFAYYPDLSHTSSGDFLCFELGVGRAASRAIV